MAITFIEKTKRLRYLFFVALAILILVIVILIWPNIFGFLLGIKPMVLPPLEITEEKTEIDFGVLLEPLLIKSRPFETVIFPSPEAKDVSLTPTLEWQSVPEAEIYDWEILGVDSGQTEETSVTITKKLEPSTTYVWRVKSCTKDMSMCSVWSGDCQTKENLGCWRFTTLERPSVILVSPSPEAKDVSLTPTLEWQSEWPSEWQSVPEAEIYDWEILGVDSGQTEETSVTITKKLEPSTTYVWRVKSCTKDMSMCSVWSNGVFTTTFVLLPPDLVSPLGEEGEEETLKEEGEEEIKGTEEVGREDPFIFY